MPSYDPGQKIKERRLALGYSRGQLAASVDTTATNVAAWERGDEAPDMHAIPKLAKVLGIGSDELAVAATSGVAAFSDASDTASAPAATKVNAGKGGSAAKPVEQTTIPGSPEPLPFGIPGAVDPAPERQGPAADRSAAELAAEADAPLAEAAGAGVEHRSLAASPAAAFEERASELLLSPSPDGERPVMPHEQDLPLSAMAPAAGAPGDDGVMARMPAVSASDAPAGLTDAATEAVPIVPVPAAPMILTTPTGRPATERTSDGSPLGDFLAAYDRFMHTVFDPERPYLFWIRTALTIIFLLIGLRVLAWALPAFFDALGDILDTIESTTPDTTAPSG